MKPKASKGIDWSKSGCGVILCTIEQVAELMPEAVPVLAQLRPQDDPWWADKLIDVKVHMLMPGMWPCIPNMHRDFLPRDDDGKRIPGGVSARSMYAWISGPPLTEYLVGGRLVRKPANVWHPFSQADVHTGTVATEHTWRCFMRVIPAQFVHAQSRPLMGKFRRHCQVYLDAGGFSW